MNAVVDYGNSRIKVGLFENNELRKKETFSQEKDFISFINENSIVNLLVSSVTKAEQDLPKEIHVEGNRYFLTHTLPLPVTIKYKTPETLGVDRIAAACGAVAVMPNSDLLVIDAGTCINIECIDSKQTYHGGSIAPGIKMRFDAMHKFTSRLPLVTAKADPILIGASTEECMQSGVVNGILAEVNGIINSYKRIYPNMGVILCGGDSSFFENNLKHPIFVAPDLVLIGLNRILLHNVGL